MDMSFFCSLRPSSARSWVRAQIWPANALCRPVSGRDLTFGLDAEIFSQRHRKLDACAAHPPRRKERRLNAKTRRLWRRALRDT